MTRFAAFLLSSTLCVTVGYHLGHRTAETADMAPLGLSMAPNGAFATGAIPRTFVRTPGDDQQGPGEPMDVAQAMSPPVTEPVAEGSSPPMLTAEAAPAVQSMATTADVEEPLDPADAELLQQMDAPPAPKVDESALRYFARQGDTARLQIEINRLKALYPDWEPPADPLAPRAAPDKALETMWSLAGEGRFALLRKAIERRQQKQPGWTPPAPLIAQLELGEARLRLVAASNDKAYERVIDEGAAHPQLLVCDEMDILWRVAEAFAKTGREPRSQDTYRYILTSCDAAKERLATMQKAAQLLQPTAIVDLLTLERRDAEGKGEFDSVRNDLARRFLSVAAKDPAATVPREFLTHMEELAESTHQASDALLLGWYHERRQKMVQAEYWFRKARAIEDTAEAAQGLALTLIARKMPQEAEDILYRWHAESDEVHATYLAAAAELLALDPPVALQPDVLARMGRDAAEVKDAALAEQFGWYARAFGQSQLAAQWFATSLSWKTDNEPAAFGLALTANDLNLPDVVARIQAEWQGRSPRIATLGQAAPETPAADGAAPALSSYYAPAQAAADPTGRLMDVAAPIADSPAQRTAAPAPQTAAAPSQRSQSPQVQPAARIAQAAPAAAATPRRQAYAAVSPEAAPARTAQPRRSAGGTRGCSGRASSASLSPAASLQRGWCLMNLKRPAEASRAFEAALESSDPQVRGDAAYGQSLAFLRLGLTENAAASASRGPMDQRKASEIQVALLTNQALAAYQSKRYTEALLLLDRRAELAPEQADLMVLRGYAYLSMQRYPQAIRIFENLASTGNRDALKGLAEARAAKNPIPGQ